ncbi:hypothetical protein AYR66_21895 [Noviherbaspirillum denitrificans]|uniref:Uncharacterized protein n=1 Tax=Noviherbaspirillum denitrificans TaxID=1968433 RepID=A0A254THT7_9BURK|nr:hypothetical protein AYR66_21895 [Noviherbaspirillum denitrificans]
MARAHGAPTLFYPFRLYPLRIIKQIIAMSFSVNAPEFRLRVPYLEQFGLNKELRHLPPDLRVLTGYTINGHIRSTGASGILDGSGVAPQLYTVSEIAFPPFCFVLTLNCPCPDRRMIVISAFATCGYYEVQSLDLRMPVLPIHSAYPTDYRTPQEVAKAGAAAKTMPSGGAKP